MVFSLEVWQMVTEIGSFEAWVIIVFISAAIYFFSPKARKPKLAWLAFVLIPAVVISATSVEALKITTQIPRPCIGEENCPSGFSFVSNHANAMFVLATAAFLNVKNLPVRIIFILLAVLVTVSRVILNYHTYVDVIAGALLGIAVTYIINNFYRNMFKHKNLRNN